MRQQVAVALQRLNERVRVPQSDDTVGLLLFEAGGKFGAAPKVHVDRLLDGALLTKAHLVFHQLATVAAALAVTLGVMPPRIHRRARCRRVEVVVRTATATLARYSDGGAASIGDQSEGFAPSVGLRRAYSHPCVVYAIWFAVDRRVLLVPREPPRVRRQSAQPLAPPIPV